MSAYDPEDSETTEQDYADVPEGFEVVESPDDPEVDLEESDLADFTFSDEDGDFALSEDDSESF